MARHVSDPHAMEVPRAAHATRLGVDIGGTFTDIVVATEAGGLAVRKILSTPEDYAAGVIAGARSALEDLGARAEDVADVVHATTVATNAILQRAGAPLRARHHRGFPRRAGNRAAAHPRDVQPLLRQASRPGASGPHRRSRGTHQPSGGDRHRAGGGRDRAHGGGGDGAGRRGGGDLPPQFVR